MHGRLPSPWRHISGQAMGRAANLSPRPLSTLDAPVAPLMCTQAWPANPLPLLMSVTCWRPRARCCRHCCHKCPAPAVTTVPEHAACLCIVYAAVPSAPCQHPRAPATVHIPTAPCPEVAQGPSSLCAHIHCTQPGSAEAHPSTSVVVPALTALHAPDEVPAARLLHQTTAADSYPP